MRGIRRTAATHHDMVIPEKVQTALLIQISISKSISTVMPRVHLASTPSAYPSPLPPRLPAICLPSSCPRSLPNEYFEYVTMEPFSSQSSVIEVIQTREAISKILRRYIIIGRVEQGWYDITRLQDEISALSQPLEPLQQLLHNHHLTQTGPSQCLLDVITKCAATLSSLQDEIEPKATQTLLSRWEFQPWKWPLEYKEVESVIREIKRYNSLFWLSLMLNQT